MGILLSDQRELCRRLPSQDSRIMGTIHFPGDPDRLPGLLLYRGMMFFRLIIYSDVGSALIPVRIREINKHGKSSFPYQITFHFHPDHIQIRVTGRSHDYRYAIQLKATCNNTLPQICLLNGVPYVIRTGLRPVGQ